MDSDSPREGGDPLCKEGLLKAKGFIYIVTNKTHGTLYIGVTNNLVRRIWEHKHKMIEGFTSTHNIHRLVYFELFDDIETAIAREKAMKKWNRNWKIKRIAAMNPEWNDLYNAVVETLEWVPACAGTTT